MSNYIFSRHYFETIFFYLHLEFLKLDLGLINRAPYTRFSCSDQVWCGVFFTWHLIENRVLETQFISLSNSVYISVSLFPQFCHQIEESKRISLTYTNFKTLNSTRGIKNMYIIVNQQETRKTNTSLCVMCHHHKSLAEL